VYKLKFTPEASQELRKEIAYSAKKWGKDNARKYICTHKGNHIIYTIDEVKKHVIVLGILSIYQQIKSDHLEERKQSGIS